MILLGLYHDITMTLPLLYLDFTMTFSWLSQDIKRPPKIKMAENMPKFLILKFFFKLTSSKSSKISKIQSGNTKRLHKIASNTRQPR